MSAKSTVPMDDGTASSEGEEPIVNKDGTATKKSEGKADLSNQSTKNSSVSYDNSDNKGKDKNINQNAVSDEKPKNN